MELTKRELEILIDHYQRDYFYGVGGTWGDGEKWNDREGTRLIGQRIIKKLHQAYREMK